MPTPTCTHTHTHRPAHTHMHTDTHSQTHTDTPTPTCTHTRPHPRAHRHAHKSQTGLPQQSPRLVRPHLSRVQLDRRTAPSTAHQSKVNSWLRLRQGYLQSGVTAGKWSPYGCHWLSVGPQHTTLNVVEAVDIATNDVAGMVEELQLRNVVTMDKVTVETLHNAR